MRAWVLFFSGFFLAPSVWALDLLSAYQLAKAHDYQYKIAQSRFQADMLNEDLGLARWLPQLSYHYRFMHNQYRSNQQMLALDEDTVNQFQQCQSATDIASCLVQSLSDKFVHARSDYNSSESNLSLTQVLYDPQVAAERAKGKALALKAVAEFSLANKQLITRLLKAYLAVLAADDAVQLLGQQMAALRQQLAIIEKRYQLGVGKPTEVYDAKAAVSQQQIILQAAATQQQVSRLQLQQIIGQPVEALADLSPSMPVRMPDFAEQWLEQAVNNNDGLKVAQTVLSMAQDEVDKNNRNRLPRVMAAANYQQLDLHGGQGFAPASSSFAYGINISLPLYQGGAIYHARKQARLNEVAAQDNLNWQKESVKTAAISLQLQLNNAVQRYQLRQAALDAAQQALKMTQKAYHNGASPLPDWLAAQNRYYQALQALSQARYDYLNQWFDLKQLTGQLSIDDVKALNAWFVQP